jgi:hypothetical protein
MKSYIKQGPMAGLINISMPSDLPYADIADKAWEYYADWGAKLYTIIRIPKEKWKGPLTTNTKYVYCAFSHKKEEVGTFEKLSIAKRKSDEHVWANNKR